MNKYFKTSLVMILAGIAALCVSAFFIISNNKQVARDTEPATATLVDYFEDEQIDSDNNTTTFYYPIVTYEVDGNTIEAQYTQGMGEKDYEVGSTIEIKYDPDNPSEFVIVGDDTITTYPVWVIVIGAALIIIGLGRILVPVIGSARSK